MVDQPARTTKGSPESPLSQTRALFTFFVMIAFALCYGGFFLKDNKNNMQLDQAQLACWNHVHHLPDHAPSKSLQSLLLSVKKLSL